MQYKANKPRGLAIIGRFQAFTVVELLIIVTALLILAALLIPSLARAKRKPSRIACTNNLKQIGTGFLIWSPDHGGLYPMAVSTNEGGTLEKVATGDVFPHFQALSDALGNSTKVLVCPDDNRNRQYAEDFGPRFSNTNISYFLGVDARRDKPQMFLAGDRNITNGMPRRNGFLELSPNHNAGWKHEPHNDRGNVLLAEASVQGWDILGLRQAIQNTGDATNRLAMP